MVTFGRKSSRRVVFSPSNMSSSRNRSLHLGFGYLTYMDPFVLGSHVKNDCADHRDSDPVHQTLLSDQDEDSGNEDVSEGEGNHPFPAEVHQLVEAESGERRPKPDVHHHERHHLRNEDERSEHPTQNAPMPQSARGQSVSEHAQRPRTEK